MSSIIEGIAEIVLEVILEFVMFYTGEIVLFIITLGFKKPRWDFYDGKEPTIWVLLTEFSVLVGLAFWITTIGLIARWLLNN